MIYSTMQLIVCLCLVFLSACGILVREEPKYFRGPEIALSDHQPVASASATSETDVLLAFVERAGLQGGLPGTASDDWQLVVRAGINAIDEQCEKYIDAIFWADRGLRTAGSQINLVGATTATLMGIFSAPGGAIAATAAAFGFGTQGMTNFSNGLLYKIEPSGIRKMVKRSQSAYRDGVEERMQVYNSRPAAVAAIQGYLSLCLPASIETQINEAVAASDFNLVEPKSEGKDDLPPVPELKRISTEERSRAAIEDDIRRDLEEMMRHDREWP